MSFSSILMERKQKKRDFEVSQFQRFNFKAPLEKKYAAYSNSEVA